MIAPKQDIHLHQIAELLDQHLFTDTANASSDFGEARWPALDVKEDQRLPFAPDNCQRHIQTAGRVRSVHANFALTFW